MTIRTTSELVASRMPVVKRIFAAILVVAFCAPLAGWADPADDWGPAVGSTLPRLEANDHTGALRNLENLAGERGLLLFLNRSADW